MKKDESAIRPFDKPLRTVMIDIQGQAREAWCLYAETLIKISSDCCKPSIENGLRYLFDFFGECRDDIEKIIHHAEVRFLEYGGLRVFVDGYDDL